MFVNVRSRKDKDFVYIEHSYRVGKQVKKASIYVPKKKGFKISDFEKKNQEAIKKIAEDRVKYYKKNLKFDKFFLYADVILNIESIKVSFQFIFSQLDKNAKNEVMAEFLRTFFVNSMEMEGGTVSYDLARAIDYKKLKSTPKDVNRSDIILYENIKKTYAHVVKNNIRSSKDIAKIHGMMYKGVYDFAGNFRKTKVTFGVTEDAITSTPNKIRSDLLNTIKSYRKSKGKIYPFEEVLRFHAGYQGIHPFRDGNSRLGRLLILKDLTNNGYPSPILKKSNSQSYRASLVRAINNNNYTALFKLFYVVYKRTWERFFKPLLEEKLKDSNVFKKITKK